MQVVGGGQPYRDLQWGHELYCFGHLVQAAIAWHRSIGDDRLLEVALRAVATVEAELGPGGRDGIDGHPEVEMALVELYRTTGDPRHLELARRMVDLRGHGLLGPGRFGPAYWQDHVPTRGCRRRSPATPCARCTWTAASSTSPWSSATAACWSPS